MEGRRVFLSAILLAYLIESCSGNILLSTLPKTLSVSASPKQGQLLKSGEDTITVSWSLNQSVSSGSDSAYKTIKVKLCYAPVSQKDRGWRKTVDNLAKDKTCQFDIVARPYSSANTTVQSFVWMVKRDTPTATYFVRAYAFNSNGDQVAYGQTTDSGKTTNLFQIQGISGRHVSLDICSICFSAFSVVSLFGFFIAGKRKAKGSQ